MANHTSTINSHTSSISSLNTLTSSTQSNLSISGYTGSAVVYKRCSIGIFVLNTGKVSSNLAVNGELKICTLPTGYRPKSTICGGIHCVINGTNMVINMFTDGRVLLINHGQYALEN